MTELEVEIYGKKYTLRGSSSESIRSVAALVDKRMREIFGSEPKPIDAPKALVLAINFAEELVEQRAKEESSCAELGGRLEKVGEKISELEKLLEM